MRLTVQTDYALRMLMHLACRADALVTIHEIAERYGISKNHLVKVAHRLGRAGFIETIRGRSGGLRLGRPAEEILVGTVARYTEQGSALVECFPGGSGKCLVKPHCRLKSVLAEAQEAFFTVLDRYTIHDLVKRNPGLLALLVGDAA